MKFHCDPYFVFYFQYSFIKYLSELICKYPLYFDVTVRFESCFKTAFEIQLTVHFTIQCLSSFPNSVLILSFNFDLNVPCTFGCENVCFDLGVKVSCGCQSSVYISMSMFFSSFDRKLPFVTCHFKVPFQFRCYHSLKNRFQFSVRMTLSLVRVTLVIIVIRNSCLRS